MGQKQPNNLCLYQALVTSFLKLLAKYVAWTFELSLNVALQYIIKKHCCIQNVSDMHQQLDALTPQAAVP